MSEPRPRDTFVVATAFTDLFCERCGTHIARYSTEPPPFRICGRCRCTEDFAAATERLIAALDRLAAAGAPPTRAHPPADPAPLDFFEERPS